MPLKRNRSRICRYHPKWTVQIFTSTTGGFCCLDSSWFFYSSSLSSTHYSGEIFQNIFLGYLERGFLCKFYSRFPGITDWKFIMMNFEDHIQVPVKKFSQSLFGNLVLAGGVVVRKISIRKQIHQKFSFTNKSY